MPDLPTAVLESLHNQHGDDHFLVFGATGWIGSQLCQLLESTKLRHTKAESRLEFRSAVLDELERVKPTRVLVAAGVTGRPNIDWCESHKVETLRANVMGTLTVVDCCFQAGVHCTVFATGCIFQYDEEHPMTLDGQPFTEEDKPNFHGSYYSHTKALMEDLLQPYYSENLLMLRIRMPISDDLHARNFITKIANYERVVNIPNSMTVLHDMLPVAIILSAREKKGILNFTNPGVISHNQCLDLYKKYIDPSFQYTNFTVEEQDKILAAPRSNNHLDATKLKAELPDVLILPIDQAVVGVFQRMKKSMVAENSASN